MGKASERTKVLGLISDDNDAADVYLYSGTSAPSGGTLPNGRVLAATDTAICFRQGATTGTTMYVTVNGGTAWTAFDPAALSGLDLNGSEFILDADGDTSITADTDDQIDIRISAADDFTFTANSFNVLTGSAIDLADSCAVKFGTGDDIAVTWDGSKLAVTQAAANSSISWGVDGAGIDHIFYGDTAGSKITWDQSADSLLITDSTPLSFGDGGDVLVQFDATNLAITTAVADTGAVAFGADGAGVDVIFFGDTSTSDLTWDQSADSLIFDDDTNLVIGTGSDDTIAHDGTDTLWTHTTGDLTFDNQLVTGSTIMVLGTDTNATDFQVQNNSASAILTVFGDGTVTLPDSVTLEIGTGIDYSIVHGGTNTVITSKTGDLITDNTGATGSTIERLGADTTAVDFQVQNNSETALLTVFGSGLVQGLAVPVDMANGKHTLTLTGAGANETDITGNVLFVDPNGGAQTLVLPAEASCSGVVLDIINTADAAEAITVKDDAEGYTVIVLDQNQGGRIACNGTVWYGFMGAET